MTFNTAGIAPTTTITQEKSLLDIALENYGKQAEQYVADLNAAENAPEDVRAERKNELDKTKRHLESQRLHSVSMASIQAQLDVYREQGRQATKGKLSEVATKQKELLAEEHHPTATLENHMRATINPKPSSYHTAHHIVAGKGKTKYAYLARVHMHGHGIRINDPDNGVWLPRYKKHTPNWAMPKAKGHLEYHTNNYEWWVSRRLETQNSEVQVRTQLNMIGKMMQANILPKEAGGAAS